MKKKGGEKMDKDCACEKCQALCIHKPGWFMPGQAEKVAEYLGISLQRVFQTKLGVDWWVDTPNVFLLAPATVGMSPGGMYPAEPRGQCIFFKDGLCSIHSVKPFECRKAYHDKIPSSGKQHSDVANAWRENQTQVEVLLGQKPEAEFFDLY